MTIPHIKQVTTKKTDIVKYKTVFKGKVGSEVIMRLVLYFLKYLELFH